MMSVKAVTSIMRMELCGPLIFSFLASLIAVSQSYRSLALTALSTSSTHIHILATQSAGLRLSSVQIWQKLVNDRSKCAVKEKFKPRLFRHETFIT